MVTTLWFDGSPADGSDRPGSRSLPDVIAQPQREADLGDDEERPDEEPHEVVDERGLLSFEAVPDELNDPAAEEEPPGREQPRPGGAGRDAASEPQAHPSTAAMTTP